MGILALDLQVLAADGGNGVFHDKNILLEYGWKRK
jgi:hypothetical protein